MLFWKYICGAALTLALGALMAPETQAQNAVDEDVVRNGGFELGIVGWDLPEGMTRIEKGVGYQSEASLRFENRDAAVYKLITQRIPVKPGDTLSFSAWIKGENITSTSTGKGAGVFVESVDANGKWITGGYTQGFAGTYDWKQDSGTYGVPSNAATVIVGLYLRKNSIGTAWFDDVQVRVQRKPEVQASLVYPNYRGLTTPTDAKPWQVRLSLPPNSKASFPVRYRLTDSEGKTVAHNTVTPANQLLQMRPPTGLKPGRYYWELEMEADKKPYKFSLPINVVAQMPKKYIDSEGFTVVDGQRFFPFGVFLGSTAQEHLQRVSDAKFNTVLAYNNDSPEQSRTYLANAKQLDIQVIFSLTNLYQGHHWVPKGVTDLKGLVTNYVQQLRDEPALLSWYINDEMGLEWLPKIQPMYDHLASLDQQHLVYQVLLDPGLAEKYSSSTDAVGTDPYPVGRATDLQRTSGYTHVLSKAAGTTKSVWMVPQIFDWGVYPKENTASHPPTLDEMRNQAYQSLIHGAKGLIFYSYFDLWYEPGTRATKQSEFDKRWPAVTAMSKEVSEVLPAILHGKTVALAPVEASKVELKAIEYKGELLLLVANPYYAEQSISMKLPDGWRVVQSKQGAIESGVERGRLTLKLPSVGAGVFRLIR